MTYDEAKAARAKLEAVAQRLSDRLNSYPRGPMGMTPDHIKATKEWKDEYRAYHVAAGKLREFNRRMVKAFRREMQAERAERRPA